MDIRHRIWLLLTCCLAVGMLHGKTVKTVTVAQGVPHTDHIALAKDATDKDIMVKFQFNESANTLTVSVISYRTLFVFWDDTRYKNVVKRHWLSGGWLHTDLLPYIAAADEGQHFRLSKQLRKQLPKPRKAYVFKKWMTYEGLQPQEKDIKMVNTYLEQTFDIQNKRDTVVVGLHDIMLLDLVKQRATKSVYSISAGGDIDTDYQIIIQRDPCFGLDKEKDAAQKALDAVTKSYKSLKKAYGSGKVNTEESRQSFEQLKATLTAQYQHNNDSSACPVIQDCISQYNLMADSLANLRVRVVTPEDAAAAAGKMMGKKGSEANAKIVVQNARLIDNKVARWLVSRDMSERADLVKECRDIINDTRLIIATLPASQQAEVKIFRQAEQYFNKTCR